MGNTLLSKVSPKQSNTLGDKYSILENKDHLSQQISRANFHFSCAIMINGYNDQQIIWIGENIRYSKQQFFIKQINKFILYDNNRIDIALRELELFKQLRNQYYIMIEEFFAKIIFAFQDYQYCYLVYQKIQGYTLDLVMKHHSFNQDQTKYIVCAIIKILEFFHQKGYSLCQLQPEHFIIEKSTGKIKLLQIFNPLRIDCPYPYTIVTKPSFYSAPQILAKDKVLAQSDYYTLGMIMYQMMTQKNVIQEELSYLQKIERNNIMAYEIQLKKYNLPEGWNPQAADFLVKLLIKNPLYRLGRYGAYQLHYHPWLQNYNWDLLITRKGIMLNQPIFDKLAVTYQRKSHNFKNNTMKQNTNINQNSSRLSIFSQSNKQYLLKDHIFLRKFSQYYYQKDFSDKKKKKISLNNGSDKLASQKFNQSNSSQSEQDKSDFSIMNKKSNQNYEKQNMLMKNNKNNNK